jgi:flagellar motor switch protein FliG
VIEVSLLWLHVHRSVGELRKELHEAISNMGMKVKFDLLHDETPQVSAVYLVDNHRQLKHSILKLDDQAITDCTALLI